MRSFISIPAGVIRMPLRRYFPVADRERRVGVRPSGRLLGRRQRYRHFHSGFDLATLAIVCVLVLIAVLAVRVQRRRAIDPAE
jgi:membrane protein DedA with SNARE-associated domain